MVCGIARLASERRERSLRDPHPEPATGAHRLRECHRDFGGPGAIPPEPACGSVLTTTGGTFSSVGPRTGGRAENGDGHHDPGDRPHFDLLSWAPTEFVVRRQSPEEGQAMHRWRVPGH